METIKIKWSNLCLWSRVELGYNVMKGAEYFVTL